MASDGGVDAGWDSDVTSKPDGKTPEAAAHASEAGERQAEQTTAQEDQPDLGAPEPSRTRSSSGRLVGLGALCAVALVGAWMVFGRQAPDRPVRPGATSTAETAKPADDRSEPVAPGSLPSAQPSPAPPQAASSQTDSPATPGVAAQSAAPEARPPTATAHSAGSAEATNAETISVTLDVRPVGSQVFRKGRYVGKAPLVIELKPGEKSAFEVNKRGYAPQKVVLDGRKTNVLIGLRPLGHH
ncbi:MAG: hypothetical protein JW940_21930 [Polyangiaceae bacterium]|nr:hypothetical protein [Polyangiaceae bacterium]